MICAPALFISHGSPTFALEPGLLGANLHTLGAQLSNLQAILVVSAHWQTPEACVTTSESPDTIHDFRGFPQELYQLRYPARGSPQFAAQAGRLLAAAGFQVTFDGRRGLDHGAWVPLRHLFPDARYPVFQVSMPHDLDTAGALRLGRVLAPLRESGVLIVGSGSLTHNLYEVQRVGATDAPYAQQFASWVRGAVLRDDAAGLANYRGNAPHAQRAHPSEEHYLPLLVAMGARGHGEAGRVIEGGMTYGVLSMESYAWGLPGPV